MEHLVEFFTQDPRAQKIGPMLSALGTTLTGEQEAMHQELIRLRGSLAAVGAVVRELDSTAPDKGVAVLETPHRIVAEVIAAADERSRRVNVAIAVDAPELTGI